jgi:hypothetical protein
VSELDLSPWVARVHAFENEAHRILGGHEAARSRVVILERTYDELAALSLKQDDLFRQALRCVENELYRAAHVMAFASFMDFVFEKLSSDGLTKLRAAYPKWVGKDIHEMAEYVPDRQFLEAIRPLGLGSKNDVRRAVSLLDRRNDCAHPTAYYPDLNMTLGYIAEVLQAVKLFKPRTL